ncbi:outer membrane protein A precursor [Hydrogenimonas sp.]|nr:outer membrane protein A precursor [Hydrogenimonas sp.]
MKKIGALLLSVAAAGTLTASEYRYSITPMFGGVEPLNKELLDNGTSLGARLGYNIDESQTIELGYDFMDSIDYKNLVPGRDTDSHQITANYLYHFLEPESRIRPYLLAGLGVEDFTNNLGGLRDGLIGNLGLGLKMKVYKDLALRLEARDFIRYDDGGHTLAYTAGLMLPFGEIEKEAPAPATVKAEVPVKAPDSDNDGVADAEDRCPNTPRGVDVDLDGCPLDTDGDGVPDYKDECKGTPDGVKVDAKGCPIDSDHDGVADFMDKCPNSKTTIVDENGCALDSDQDGVADYLDKCPATPKDFKVDAQGCAVGFTMHVNFATNSAKIESKDTPYIDKLVKFMKEHPQTKVRLEGYTDSDGSAAYNLKLSAKRAEAVKKELISRGIEASRITTKAYGEENPVASNDTPEGKAQNRRVEAVLIPTRN